MQPSILSLLPPIVVLAVGYYTHKTARSLFIGIIAASLIATHFSVTEGAFLTGYRLWTNLELGKIIFPSLFWECWNVFIALFLLMLGCFVLLIQHSGGASAYGTFVRRHFKSKMGIETSSLILSSLLFIDDYLSCLTVGSVMRPLADKERIPRAKLAFLVDAMAAPLALLCPFSSWAAAMIGFMRDNGISSEASPETLIIAEPYSTFLSLLPFFTYSLILMFSTWFMVRCRISFGLMRIHEEIAEETGNLLGGELGQVRYRLKMPIEEDVEEDVQENHLKPTHSMIDFFVPILLLLLSVIGGILYSGDAFIFGGKRGILSAFHHASSASALFLGGGTALLLTIMLLLIRKKISIKKLPFLMLEGVKLMFPATLVLMLAWTLGDIMRSDLYTGHYLASILSGSISISILPLSLFLISFIIAFMIGTSWGTTAIMFPIVIPMMLDILGLSDQTPVPLEEIPWLFPLLGAVLSGAVAGNHISPISDTTIMSSSSTMTPNMMHIRTRNGYALPVIGATAVSFLIQGVLQTVICSSCWTPLGIALGTGCVLSALVLYKMNGR